MTPDLVYIDHALPCLYLSLSYLFKRAYVFVGQKGAWESNPGIHLWDTATKTNIGSWSLAG